jgi:hypothetical protein
MGSARATRRLVHGHGRSLLRRKLIDNASTAVLLALVLTTLVLMFAGGDVAQDTLGSASRRQR